MPLTASQRTDMITAYRAAMTALLNNADLITDLRKRWDTAGYSAAIVDADFVGDNVGILAADLSTAVGNATTVYAGLTDPIRGTLEKLRKGT